jgi:hypothetical protein
VYRRLPYAWKLNASVFSKAALLLCKGPVAAIPDANTGARMGASWGEEFLSARRLALQRKLHQLKPTISTDGSWPDWPYYVSHSQKLKELWQRPNQEAFDLFRRVLGPEHFRPDVAAYRGQDLFVFVSLLTLKLWLEKRV